MKENRLTALRRTRLGFQAFNLLPSLTVEQNVVLPMRPPGGAPPALSRPLYIPPLVYGAFAGTIIVLGLTAAGLPARAALRRDTLEQ
jgi:ABC-type antimicrobial peptide transport system permease subunit